MTLVVIGAAVVIAVAAFLVWRAKDPKWRMTRKDEDEKK